MSANDESADDEGTDDEGTEAVADPASPPKRRTLDLDVGRRTSDAATELGSRGVVVGALGRLRPGARPPPSSSKTRSISSQVPGTPDAAARPPWSSRDPPT